MALPDAARALPKMNVDRMGARAREASDFLKALAHESRLMILCDLIQGERSVGELEALLSLRQSTVSLSGFLGKQRSCRIARVHRICGD